MIARIHVHNRAQIERLEPRPNALVISIWTPDSSVASIKDGWHSVHRFCFSDLAGTQSEVLLWKKSLEEMGRKVILFSEEMAKQIFEVLWIAHFSPEVEEVVVHCDAGVSRSQAVARVVRDAWGVDVISHTISTDHAANGLVLQIMHRIMWEDESYPLKDEPGNFLWEESEEYFDE